MRRRIQVSNGGGLSSSSYGGQASERRNVRVLGLGSSSPRTFRGRSATAGWSGGGDDQWMEQQVAGAPLLQAVEEENRIETTTVRLGEEPSGVGIG